MGYFQPKVIYRNESDARENSIVRYIGNRVLKSNKNFLCAITGSTGCQPKNSKVLMADGSWKNIQDIKVGDLVLSPQKNKTNTFSRVKWTTKWFCDNVHVVKQLNKAKKELYKCSDNHFIPFFYCKNIRETIEGKRNHIRDEWSIREFKAKEIYKASNRSLAHKKIGFSSFPIESYLNRTNCEIEPYVLGLFLGDGMYCHKLNITLNKDYNIMKRKDKKLYHERINSRLSFEISNKNIIEYIEKFYGKASVYQKPNCLSTSYDFSLLGVLSKQLIKYNLRGVNSATKFIPKEALLSNLTYRKKLLAGLIDSDGYFGKGGYHFTLKSKQLIKDIKNLVYSLGGRTGEIYKVNKTIKSLNFTGTYYSITIYLRDLKLPILEQRKIKTNRCCYLDANRIAINTEKSEPCEVYGFELDSESHWYITDNWMVTKNSGKSYSGFGMQEIYSKMFNIPFDPNVHIISSLKEMLLLITSKDVKKKIRFGSTILFDEPQVEANARSWQSEMNQALGQLISTFRNQRLVVFFATPYLEMIDKQSRILFHGEFKVDGYDRGTKLTTLKPRFLEYNKKRGDFYRKRLIVVYRQPGKNVMTSTKLHTWHVPLASKETIDIYEAKKKKFSEILNMKLLKQIELQEKQIEGKNKSDELFQVRKLYNKFGEDFIKILKEMPHLSPFVLEKYLQFIKKSEKLAKE